MKKAIFVILIFIGIVTACEEGYSKTINRHSLPKADIVFQTIIYDDEESVSGKDKLGFYLLETGEIAYVDWDLHLMDPYYLSDDTLIAIKKKYYWNLLYESNGWITIISKDYYVVECNSSEAFGGSIYPYQGNILFFGESGIVLIDSKDCSVIKTILKRDDLISYKLKASTALSNDGNFLMTSSDFELIRVDLTDMSIFSYGVYGILPSLSPDGTKIAYLGYDGIHLIDYDGRNDVLLVEYQAAESINGDFHKRGFPPLPNWSRDGSKLVYHKCIRNLNQSCLGVKDNSIFIYDLETYTETQIIEGGINPSWR